MIERYWKHPLFIPALFAAAKLLLQLYVNAIGGYGFFRDELYYIVSTDHLSAGYVDHPPLSIFILAVSKLLFGDSLFAIRLIPAVASAGVVFLAGVLARGLGGGRTAQVLACSAAFVSIILHAFGTFYSMNILDMLIWSLAFLQLMRLVRQPTTREWLILGVILGLGLLNKIGVLWLGAGIFAGIILTPLRSELRKPGPWLAGATALMLFLPFIVWNALNDWAHIEFIRNATGDKYAGLTIVDFLGGQFLVQNPVTAPLWIGGLVWFFTTKGKEFRLLGITYIVCLVVLIANGHSKPEYLSSFYTVLFASGGVLFESFPSRGVKFLATRAYAVILAIGLVMLPITLPILPVGSYIRFAETIGIQPSTAESKELAELPQFYADMFGWPELAENVIQVYESLPDSERASCLIFGGNYGEASAVIFFGRDREIPRVVSGHNSYFLWGPGEENPGTVIVIGGREENHRQSFDSVVVAATHRADYAMPYENDLPIYVCRGLKIPISKAWSRVKNYS